MTLGKTGAGVEYSGCRLTSDMRLYPAGWCTSIRPAGSMPTLLLIGEKRNYTAIGKPEPQGYPETLRAYDVAGAQGSRSIFHRRR